MKETWSEENISKNVDFSLWGNNRATTQNTFFDIFKCLKTHFLLFQKWQKINLALEYKTTKNAIFLDWKKPDFWLKFYCFLRFRFNENDENQIFLCCASQKIREDQIDFCPKFWFREFSNKSSNNSRKNNNNSNKCSCRKRVQTVIWRICFLLTCLPMCYPCYLSRSIRRRKRQKIISSDMVSQERLGIQVLFGRNYTFSRNY